MFNKLKIKISYKKIVHWIYFFILFSCAAVLYFLYQFLYTNLYQTVTSPNAAEAQSIDSEDKSVNITAFDKTIEKIKQKTDRRKIENINSPFN